jgi:hypothetical protein
MKMTFHSNKDCRQAREITKKKNAAPCPKWYYGNLVKPDNEMRFIHMKEIPLVLMLLKYSITRYILEYILHPLYSMHHENGTSEDLEQFIGISLYLSIIILPATRRDWSRSLGHPVVYEIMSCNRWEEIKLFIHFNDNTNFIPAGQNGHDILHKIRPLIEKVHEKLLLAPKEEYLAVVEQIIPTKQIIHKTI